MGDIYSTLRRLVGLEIEERKAAVEPMTAQNTSALYNSGGWLGTIRESFSGAWQRGVEVSAESVLTHSTVWACITLISSDIAKLWIRLMASDENRINTETDSPEFSALLRKPNHFQTRVKFIESWLLSKLTSGNAYVIKARNGRGVVDSLYVLDPQRVQTLVAPNGNVYYDLSQDWLAGLTGPSVRVPASEIIHDVGIALYHPLCGVSPIHACGMAAMQGLRIQSSSLELFAKGLQISGIITSPNSISNEAAERIERYWIENYMGSNNVGKIPVLGDGLSFQPRTSLTAVDAQLIDQLKWSSEFICSVFHVPPYMVGIGAPPANANVQSLTLAYYSQALQALIENLELLLTEGLGLPSWMSVEFDLAALLRMDTATQTEALAKAVGAGIMTPNEARAQFDLPPVEGGDSPYLQQQNWSLAALNKRDQAPPTPPPTPARTSGRQLHAEELLHAPLPGKSGAVIQKELDEISEVERLREMVNALEYERINWISEQLDARARDTEA